MFQRVPVRGNGFFHVSTHICAGNVSSKVFGIFTVSFSFQLIYVRGMFCMRSDVFTIDTSVSTHICAGNVSGFWAFSGKWYVFQLIYVRGMFPSASGIGRWSTRWFQLIYVRGECFNTGRGHQPMGISFNSYMCGEYFWRLVDVISNVKCVSTHICAGNVSKQELAFDRNLKVSTHICAGNVSLGQDTEYIEIQFQLIYVRGMFPSRVRSKMLWT